MLFARRRVGLLSVGVPPLFLFVVFPLVPLIGSLLMVRLALTARLLSRARSLVRTPVRPAALLIRGCPLIAVPRDCPVLAV